MLRKLKEEDIFNSQKLFEIIKELAKENKKLTKRVKQLEQKKKPIFVLGDINISSLNDNTITSSNINAGISTSPNFLTKIEKICSLRRKNSLCKSIFESRNDVFNRKDIYELTRTCLIKENAEGIDIFSSFSLLDFYELSESVEDYTAYLFQCVFGELEIEVLFLTLDHNFHALILKADELRMDENNRVHICLKTFSENDFEISLSHFGVVIWPLITNWEEKHHKYPMNTTKTEVEISGTFRFSTSKIFEKSLDYCYF